MCSLEFLKVRGEGKDWGGGRDMRHSEVRISEMVGTIVFFGPNRPYLNRRIH